jgi:hypothetical protein
MLSDSHVVMIHVEPVCTKLSDQKEIYARTDRFRVAAQPLADHCTAQCASWRPYINTARYGGAIISLGPIMKVILTGATGFIGGAVLRRCLRLPAITSVVVLSRRALPESFAHPKLKVIKLDDFGAYPESVLAETKGAAACIWYVSVSWRFPPPLFFVYSQSHHLLLAILCS